MDSARRVIYMHAAAHQARAAGVRAAYRRAAEQSQGAQLAARRASRVVADRPVMDYAFPVLPLPGGLLELLHVRCTATYARYKYRARHLVERHPHDADRLLAALPLDPGAVVAVGLTRYGGGRREVVVELAPDSLVLVALLFEPTSLAANVCWVDTMFPIRRKELRRRIAKGWLRPVLPGHRPTPD